MNSVSSSVNFVSSVVNYSYLSNSDLLCGWSNGTISVGRTYEANRNLLTQVKNMASGNLIGQFDYQNDALGRRTQRLDSGASASTNLFAYNPRSELTNALMGANSFAWALDPIGNRVSDASNSITRFYAANNLNQYISITNGGLKTLSYDLDGNLTNDGVFAYTWDAENRLASASNAFNVVQFSYDFMSRRYWKVVNGVTNTFVWDGWNMVQEVQSSASGLQTNAYVWGLDLSGSLQGAGGIGGLLSWNRSGDNAVFFCLADANGNVTDLVDSNGSSAAHYEWDAYGNALNCTGVEAGNNRFRFSSKYLDDETALYYYGYRWYSPSLGRWASRDPMGERGAINLALFAGNCALGKVDVLGLASFWEYFDASAEMLLGTLQAWVGAQIVVDSGAVLGSLGLAISQAGADSAVAGLRDIVQMAFGFDPDPGTPVEEALVLGSTYVTGVPGSELEFHALAVYGYYRIACACATATAEFGEAYEAVKGMRIYVPERGWVLDGDTLTIGYFYRSEVTWQQALYSTGRATSTTAGHFYLLELPDWDPPVPPDAPTVPPVNLRKSMVTNSRSVSN